MAGRSDAGPRWREDLEPEAGPPPLTLRSLTPGPCWPDRLSSALMPPIDLGASERGSMTPTLPWPPIMNPAPCILSPTWVRLECLVNTLGTTRPPPLPPAPPPPLRLSRPTPWVCPVNLVSRSWWEEGAREEGLDAACSPRCDRLRTRPTVLCPVSTSWLLTLWRRASVEDASVRSRSADPVVLMQLADARGLCTPVRPIAGLCMAVLARVGALNQSARLVPAQSDATIAPDAVPGRACPGRGRAELRLVLGRWASRASIRGRVFASASSALVRDRGPMDWEALKARREVEAALLCGGLVEVGAALAAPGDG